MTGAILRQGAGVIRSYESWSINHSLRCGPAPPWPSLGSRQANPKEVKFQSKSQSVDTPEFILLIRGGEELKGSLVEWKRQLNFKMPPSRRVSSPAPTHFISTATLSQVWLATAFCHPSNSAFSVFFLSLSLPAFPITPDSSQKDLGTWGIFESLIIFHTPSWWKFWENWKQELTTVCLSQHPGSNAKGRTGSTRHKETWR